MRTLIVLLNSYINHKRHLRRNKGHGIHAHKHNLDELIASTTRPAVNINSESLIYKLTDAH